MGSYLLSLPERVLRSAATLAAALVQELGSVALPSGVRRTKLYRALVEQTLRFLIEQVGGVEGKFPDETKLAENFIVRRTAGNGLELIGILTFHASPVWVLAALADLSGAGRQLIQEISASLKQEGLLDPNTQFETVDQLLDGLESSSGRLAETVNTPPLDVAGLRQEWAAIRAAAAKIPTPELPDIDGLRRQWTDLQDEAHRQDRSVFELSSLMALSALRRLPANLVWLSKAGSLAIRRAGAFYAGGLLEHYQTTLREIRDKGFWTHWRDEFRPYLRAAAGQFSPQRLSLTERWLKRSH